LVIVPALRAGSPPRAWGRRNPHNRGVERPGSPPRAWGRHLLLRKHPRLFRFTPTGVGTTAPDHFVPVDCAVHPHGRGDDSRRPIFRLSRDGSPPRAWGRPTPGKTSAYASRFTPTGVGTTVLVGVGVPTGAVHPHGRGDDGGLRALLLLICGSPPRAWGRLRPIQIHQQNIRFTPTGVGTTRKLRQIYQNVAVHPHGRGDDVRLLAR